jgi:hypothetical protein
MVVIESMGSGNDGHATACGCTGGLGVTLSITNAQVVRFVYLEALRDVSVYESFDR